jgi:hypothetical protein
MKKRSIGVSIFGWWYAIVGGFGILSFPVLLIMRAASNALPPKDVIFMKQFAGTFYLLYALAMSIATLVAGIGILKLKSWARKLLIIICIIGMVYSVFYSVNILMHSSEFVEASLSSNTLPSNTSPETLTAIKSFTQAIMIVSTFIGIIFGIGFLIFVLWFFMRKSVKEQFEPEKFQSAAEQIK